MFNRFCCAVLVMALLWPGAAMAQKCEADYEVIVDLSYPLFGSYYVWDGSYGGKEQIERFISGTVSNKGANVVAVGERQLNEEGKKTLLLVEFDRRGRVTWEKTREVKDLINVVKILPRKGGYLVIGNQAESKTKARVWLGFFGDDGAFVREKFVRDNGFSLSGNDLAESFDGKSYVLAATAERVGSGGPYAILYWLDKDGNVKADKAYQPGLENRLVGLAAMPDNGFIATGMMSTEQNRKAGWALRTDHEGNIKWQRQYPRGLAAKLIEPDRYIDPYVLVSGEVTPSDGGKHAAWLMVIDGNSGDIGWQRFYRAAFDVYAQRVIAHPDNQISFLLGMKNAPESKIKEETGLEEKFYEYLRLLNLSPRGDILFSDPYFQGEGAGAEDMFLGPSGERIITGHGDIAYTSENNNVQGPEIDASTVEISRDGWMVAGAPAEPYKDPCVRPYTFFP
jgi:hypothetical protein